MRNETAQNILEAATEEFAQYGYYGARVNSIADRANINKERIYDYFKSKENLFVEVWNEIYNLNIEADQKFYDLIDENNVHDMGKIILNYYMEFHEKHPNFWKIYAWENLRCGIDNEPIKDLKKPVFQYLEKMYVLGQENGSFNKDVSFQTYMFVLISIAFGFSSNKSTMKHTLGLDFDNKNTKDKYVKEIEEWFL